MFCFDIMCIEYRELFSPSARASMRNALQNGIYRLYGRTHVDAASVIFFFSRAARRKALTEKMMQRITKGGRDYKYCSLSHVVLRVDGMRAMHYQRRHVASPRVDRGVSSLTLVVERSFGATAVGRPKSRPRFGEFTFAHLFDLALSLQIDTTHDSARVFFSRRDCTASWHS